MTMLVPLSLVVAVAAAVRSTWSPCGLSMLSSINPVGEAGRGNRFARTAGWYLAGSVAGGATLGAAMAVAADGLRLSGAGPTGLVAAAAVLAVAAAAVDLGLLGVTVPVLRRQVDERWLDRYRSWVYGAGFGWQIGVGVATYVMTAAVGLTVALGVLTARPWVALAAGTAFGAARGLTVLLGRWVDGPEALRRAHRLLDRWAAPVRAGVIGVQLVVAELLAATLGWPAALAAAAAVVAVGAAARLPLRSAAPRSPAA